MIDTIIHVIPSIHPGGGGPPRSLIAQCRAVHLASPGVRTIVLSTTDQVDARWHDHLRKQLPGELILADAFRWGRDRLWSNALIGRLHRLTRNRSSVVVIHALFDPISTATALYCRTFRVPFVVRPLGSLSTVTFGSGYSQAKRAWMRAFGRQILESAHAIHFTSPEEAEEAAHLGLTLRSFVAPLPMEAVATPARAPVAGRIVMMGRFHPIKRFEDGIRAMPIVRHAHPGAHLVIAGDGADPYKQALQDAARAPGMEGCVSFEGWVDGDDKRRLLASASVLLHPSAHENFGVAVAEALMASVPVVLRRGLAFTGALAAENAALLFEGGPNGVASALQAIFADDERLHAMGANGAKFARRTFDPLSVGKALLKGFGVSPTE